eukprot:scaffold8.g1684.t1
MEDRKARLARLREEAAAAGEVDEGRQAEQQPAEEPTLKFRNYAAKDDAVEPAKVPEFEEVKVDPEAVLGGEDGEELLINVAPKKANWDLRRDIAGQLAKLERRTQAAMIKLMQQEEARRLAEEGGVADATEAQGEDAAPHARLDGQFAATTVPGAPAAAAGARRPRAAGPAGEAPHAEAPLVRVLEAKLRLLEGRVAEQETWSLEVDALELRQLARRLATLERWALAAHSKLAAAAAALARERAAREAACAALAAAQRAQGRAAYATEPASAPGAAWEQEWRGGEQCSVAATQKGQPEQGGAARDQPEQGAAVQNEEHAEQLQAAAPGSQCALPERSCRPPKRPRPN